MPPIAIPILVFVWHFFSLVVFSAILEFDALGIFSDKGGSELFRRCVLIGGIGGILYCARGIYLNYCVRQQWENRWLVWHIIRPFAALICGGVCFAFLKLGLVVLEAKTSATALQYGYYAVSFLAGYNVDNFLKKIEEISKAFLGIHSSRASNFSSEDKRKQDS